MVKLKKEQQQDAELYFVQLKNPGDVRRHILESLKDILNVLQRFEKFKKLRHEKIEKIRKLDEMLKQTNKLIGALRGKLPQTNLKAVTAEEAKEQKKKHGKKKKKEKAPEQEQPKKEMTELERLESELNSIEGKLKSLTQ